MALTINPGYHEMIGRKRNITLKYTPDTLWEKAYDYFTYMQDRAWKKIEVIKGGELAGVLIEVPVPTPFSLESFCLFAGIGKNTLYLYQTSEAYEEFHDTVKQIKMIIDSQHFEGGMTQIYHAGLAARKLGLADRQDITSGDEKLAPPVIIFKRTDETSLNLPKL